MTSRWAARCSAVHKASRIPLGEELYVFQIRPCLLGEVRSRLSMQTAGDVSARNPRHAVQSWDTVVRELKHPAQRIGKGSSQWTRPGVAGGVVVARFVHTNFLLGSEQ
jgi:hypothetical protein